MTTFTPNEFLYCQPTLLTAAARCEAGSHGSLNLIGEPPDIALQRNPTPTSPSPSRPDLHPTELKLGAVLAEGKTKLIQTAEDHPGQVYLVAKDAITAHNGTRKGQMEGKGVIATATCAAVFRYLEAVGR